MNFKSDNTAGVCTEILEAIVAASKGKEASYGNDSYSKKLTEKVAEIFEHEVTIFLTSTGTAANSLALSALVPPHGAVYCHPRAHINTDECGAPEFFTGGKLIAVASATSFVDLVALEPVITFNNECAPHASKPAAISVTQQTEDGAVYSLADLAAQLVTVLKTVVGTEFVYSVQGNEIFVRMPKPLADFLLKNGAQFYPWGGDVYRLVTSFATTKEEVVAFEVLIKKYGKKSA